MVPWFRFVSSHIFPLWFSIIFLQIVNPIPVPLWLGIELIFVNNSKTFSLSDSSRPMPLSFTLQSIIFLLMYSQCILIWGYSFVFLNLMAFKIKLENTCSMRLWCPSILGKRSGIIIVAFDSSIFDFKFRMTLLNNSWKFRICLK